LLNAVKVCLGVNYPVCCWPTLW